MLTGLCESLAEDFCFDQIDDVIELCLVEVDLRRSEAITVVLHLEGSGRSEAGWAVFGVVHLRYNFAVDVSTRQRHRNRGHVRVLSKFENQILGDFFMNNGELKIFNYKNNEVKTTIKDGEIWWVLKDVCKILGLNDAHKVAYCVLKKMSGIRVRSPIILVGLKVQP